MNFINITLSIFVLLTIWLTITATFQVYRSDLFTEKQKIIHYCMIFLIPLIFPLFIISIIQNHYKDFPKSQNPVRVGFKIADVILLTYFSENPNQQNLNDSGSNSGDSD